MDRTTLILPAPLKQKLMREAKRQNISFGKLVRRVLEKFIVSQNNPHTSDTFLSSNTVFADNGPTNVSTHHDDYLNKINVHGDNV